jgi:hypothetical protein
MVACIRIRTVNAGGHAHAHDPGIDIMRMNMNPDLGIFAPLKMPMRINPKIFCILHFWPYISSKFFINNIIRLNSTRAIDWCINCHA